ncbi:UDP-glucose/GDP-mannose dehydrogenase family protein [Gulosibacter sp. 10]|uniref:UDP-glucose dehydrogenase family protein n=1 Tax=Gulosibacter sp. 10 TaxID=1255570 RepID=UPI00097F326B|nr:UDP-glucose/GDP-mannose dehydrogenase family protein [Gulosibacter sp. 10]SJM66178.1 UDP-glucose dehydrogenase [Gulosibacter sp. 10]
MKRISVVGCGYLGAVHAACMAELGHSVVGIDTDADRIAALAAGRAPFFEPGLAELLRRGVESGRLRFSTDYAEAADAEVHFIAVGTPQVEGGDAADLRFIEAAADSLLAALSGHGGAARGPGEDGPLVVGKSTVPVGTAAALAERLRPAGIGLAWNPEFLREGFAVQDTLSPDRLVYGLDPDPEAARRAERSLDEVYAELLSRETPKVVADYATAELVKTSANAFLATKISFINAMAELCDATGADVATLAEAIGHDDRIGRKFLRAGIGFGGGCLPKDIRAFAARAEELGAGESLDFLRDVDALNTRQRTRVIELLRARLDGPLEGARIAVLGAAFKPDSDDIRDSPALDVARTLARLGARVRIADPEAADAVRRLGTGCEVVDSAAEATADADAVMVLTEWPQFRSLDPAEVRERVAHPLVVDGRNCLDAATWRAAGWTYVGMGRR